MSTGYEHAVCHRRDGDSNRRDSARNGRRGMGRKGAKFAPGGGAAAKAAPSGRTGQPATRSGDGLPVDDAVCKMAEGKGESDDGT